MRDNRDDFSKQTTAEIAKSVGYRCSNPDCGRATVAANAAQDGIVTIGMAAHICAAAAKGPRYDKSQTPAQRRAKENGIWLCRDCGTLIDADQKQFPVDRLLKWKRDAQVRALRELMLPLRGAESEAARIASSIATDNVSLADSEYYELFARACAAAAQDLASFRRDPMWRAGAIELTLRLAGDDAPPFKISKLPPALEVAPEITIVAPPGTGKTTTLLQLAGYVVEENSIVPLYFRLGDWIATSASLLRSLAERSAFANVTETDLRELARRGRLLLLLDGWNELDSDQQRRLRIELAQIRRDYPDIRVVVTTRRQMLDVPIAGPRVDVEPLSEEQQMALAETQFGPAGARAVDEAWRTPGVRDLIAIPLYLSALLSAGVAGHGVSSKEQVLRLFIKKHEHEPEHAEALQAALFGCHGRILTALASHLNEANLTTLSDSDARRIVAEQIARLCEQGQLAALVEPAKILDALVGHHTLMRPGAHGAIAFQHQQFQEWFASNDVEELMRANASRNEAARRKLSVAILDQPSWEESVLFAVERVSREDSGAPIVAEAIRLALCGRSHARGRDDLPEHRPSMGDHRIGDHRLCGAMAPARHRGSCSAVHDYDGAARIRLPRLALGVEHKHTNPAPDIADSAEVSSSRLGW